MKPWGAAPLWGSAPHRGGCTASLRAAPHPGGLFLSIGAAPRLGPFPTSGPTFCPTPRDLPRSMGAAPYLGGLLCSVGAAPHLGPFPTSGLFPYLGVLPHIWGSAPHRGGSFPVRGRCPPTNGDLTPISGVSSITGVLATVVWGRPTAGGFSAPPPPPRSVPDCFYAVLLLLSILGWFEICLFLSVFCPNCSFLPPPPQ